MNNSNCDVSIGHSADSLTFSCADSANITLTSGNSTPIQKSRKMEETGRVERGRESNQDFHQVNDSFNNWYDHFVEFHILPVSKKQKTIRDVKEYCGNCGRRRRKNENFCPSCGDRF